jgi:hypothetical protein
MNRIILVFLLLSSALNAMNHDQHPTLDVRFTIERDHESTSTYFFLQASGTFPADNNATYRFENVIRHRCQATTPTITINQVARILTIRCGVQVNEGQHRQTIVGSFTYNPLVRDQLANLLDDCRIRIRISIHHPAPQAFNNNLTDSDFLDR